MQEASINLQLSVTNTNQSRDSRSFVPSAYCSGEEVRDSRNISLVSPMLQELGTLIYNFFSMFSVKVSNFQLYNKVLPFLVEIWYFLTLSVVAVCILISGKPYLHFLYIQIVYAKVRLSVTFVLLIVYIYIYIYIIHT